MSMVDRDQIETTYGTVNEMIEEARGQEEEAERHLRNFREQDREDIRAIFNRHTNATWLNDHTITVPTINAPVTVETLEVDDPIGPIPADEDYALRVDGRIENEGLETRFRLLEEFILKQMTEIEKDKYLKALEAAGIKR